MSGKSFWQRLGQVGCIWAMLGGALLPASEPDDERPLSPGETARLVRVKAMAEAGKARAQTRLAEFYLAQGEVTNAVTWFQRAAQQGEVTAQLALASCYLAGQGTARNEAEAARLLRAAAARLEAQAAANSRPAARLGAEAPRLERVWIVQAPTALALEAPSARLRRASP